MERSRTLGELCFSSDSAPNVWYTLLQLWSTLEVRYGKLSIPFSDISLNITSKQIKEKNRILYTPLFYNSSVQFWQVSSVQYLVSKLWNAIYRKIMTLVWKKFTSQELIKYNFLKFLLRRYILHDHVNR